jgi:hypothetical protein
VTEAEQRSEINYPSFFGAIGDKITAAKSSMDSVPVQVNEANDWLITNVNQVPIKWLALGDDYRVQIGTKDGSGLPIYDIIIPFQWLAA